jgi:carbonic anhydrase
MKKIIRFSALAVVIFCTACNYSNPENADRSAISKSDSGVAENVLTEAERAKLTPDQVISAFKEGNKRFVNNSMTHKDFQAEIRKSADGQFPEAVILTCMDSRVPPEYIFDEPIGDVFVLRIAGNIINEDILGSMEYGCKEAGAKLILIMGHKECGAVKAAVAAVKLDHVTALLEKLQPAINESAGIPGEKTVKNHEYINMICLNNVFNVIAEIKSRSPILKKMSDNGEIKIVGAFYDLHTGVVTFLE